MYAFLPAPSAGRHGRDDDAPPAGSTFKVVVAELFGDEFLDDLVETRQVRLGDLPVRAHPFPLGAQGLGDERRKEDDRHVPHARVIADMRGEAVPVHVRHLDIRDDQLDLVGHAMLRPGKLIAQAAQIFPGLVAVGLVRHAEARLFQRGADDVPQGGGVVYHQQMIVSRAFDGRGVHFHMAHVQRRVEAGEDLFHIQHKKDAVLDAQDAGDAFARIVVDVGVGGLHAVPGQTMDARHRRDEERRLHAAEFRHQDLVGLALHEPLAEPCRQIHQGEHPAAQIERPQRGAIAVARHVGDARQADDLQHFGHVDAVVPRIGRTVRQFFRQEEFDDFQLVVLGFKQADLAHVQTLPVKRFWLPYRPLYRQLNGSEPNSRIPTQAIRPSFCGQARSGRVARAGVPVAGRRRSARSPRSGGTGHGRHPGRTRPCDG